MDESNGLVSFNNDGIARADSRKIAEQLDIDHHNFYAMVKKYEEEVSKDFGKVLFDSEPLQSGQKQYYAKLTEDQSYVYLAYSQNTEPARRCKRLLVKAFAEARAELVQVAPALPEPAISFRYELRLVVTNAEEAARAKLLMAQAEQLVKTASQTLDNLSQLQSDILKYVKDLSERFQPPTARDLSRYILYTDRAGIEQEANILVAQNKLAKDQSGRSPRYWIP